MQVNELAKRAEVQPHIVRYYTQIGLLTPTRDPNNGYREYPADTGKSPCPEVRELVKVRSQENRVRLEELKRLQARVEDAVAVWDTLPDRPPDHDSLCHLIDTVALGDERLT